VSVAWLRAHLADPDLLLVQVSPTRRIYNRRHLPGAAYGDLHRELALRGRDPATGDAVREWLLPTREHVEAALVRWGVGELTAGAADSARTPAGRAPRVVFYDDVGQNRQAIRGYWLLRLCRYPAGRVHVLDGGLPAWTAAGGPVTDADPRPPRGTGRARAADGPGATDAAPPAAPIRLGPLDPDLIATADQVLAWSTEASSPGGPTRILDVRTADEFVGFDDRGARHGGRIPGARNRLFSDFLRPDNTLRPVPEALALLRGSGVDPDEVRAVYCQGGVRAALGWFVLHELAGLDGVRNYAGSWEEWGNRDDLPFASDVPPTTAVAPAPAATPEQPS
jgi:thiosulfate/3-mercaptopyruvate sulfurtransferase